MLILTWYCFGIFFPHGRGFVTCFKLKVVFVFHSIHYLPGLCRLSWFKPFQIKFEGLLFFPIRVKHILNPNKSISLICPLMYNSANKNP